MNRNPKSLIKLPIIAGFLAYFACTTTYSLLAEPITPSSSAATTPTLKSTPQERPALTVRLTILSNKETGNGICDFGAVRTGQGVKRIFVLRNDTSKALQLDRLIPSCGCTSARVLGDFTTKEKKLLPGASARVQVTLDTAKIPTVPTTALTGSQVEEQVLIYIVGQPVHAAATLQLRGRITTGVAFDPPLLNLSRVDASQGTTRVVRVLYDKDLYADGQTALTSPGDERIQVTALPNLTGKPGIVSGRKTTAAASLNRTQSQHSSLFIPAKSQVVRAYQIRVAPHAPAGPLSGVLVVKGLKGTPAAPSSSPPPALCLPYVGEIKGTVSAEPNMAVFGVVHLVDAEGKALTSKKDTAQRTCWVLLLRPSASKESPQNFWLKAQVQTTPAYFQAALVPIGSVKVDTSAQTASQPLPPSLSEARLSEGAACWLRVTLLPSAPRTASLSGQAVLRFPNGERMNVPILCQTD